ncbi:heterokaryon incompatibility protein-domain-containing protein [Lophiotrema nucula]|uniref:Heterokaryon incompatibility protein-domain-containing protein n=1 Tax=Lophiotrema nucula TaxID=690887 RepID=A0A6A5ZDI2_9PLEO|nr:heterokaryon incompatibility protein-domain-containing protein [Lophiotrema nucula]
MNWSQIPHAGSVENDDWYSGLRMPREEALQHRLIQEASPNEITHLPSLPEYHYSPLPENHEFIRVLCLERPRRVLGWPTEIPCASVLCVPLTGGLPFAALSYVWGNASKKCPILLDGCVFWVTESLNGALERFQEQDRTLFIWADAVCINQENPEEKGAQVQEMGNIYRTALVVLAWLGPAADDSELALKSLGYVGRSCLDMPDGPAIQERHDFFSRVLPMGEDKPENTFPTEPAVALFNRPWWSRIWVIQEVVLSRNVHIMCGNSSTEFSVVSSAFTALFELPLLNAQCQNTLSHRIEPLAPIHRCQPRLIDAAIGIGQGTQSLTMTMLRATSFGATDPRDHIYALLGMISDVEELGLVVDYTKPCSDTFSDVAAAILQRQHNFQILSRNRDPKSQQNLPSWVPDWSQPFPVMICDARFPLFSAGASTQKQQLRVEENMLIVRGAILGPVKHLGWSWESINPQDLSNIPQLVRTALGQINSFAGTNCTAYGTLKDLEEAIWRTPIVDTEFGLFGEHGRYNRRATAQVQQVFNELCHSEPTPSVPTEQIKMRYIGATVSQLENRQYFCTSTGHLGLGPLGMRVGDLVCTIIDADVPFIIRAKKGQSVGWFRKRRMTHYKFVGECYVHGIMDGEIWSTDLDAQDLVFV